jgi:hypothetical protein
MGFSTTWEYYWSLYSTPLWCQVRCRSPFSFRTWFCAFSWKFRAKKILATFDNRLFRKLVSHNDINYNGGNEAQFEWGFSVSQWGGNFWHNTCRRTYYSMMLQNHSMSSLVFVSCIIVWDALFIWRFRGIFSWEQKWHEGKKLSRILLLPDQHTHFCYLFRVLLSSFDKSGTFILVDLESILVHV